MDWQNLTTFVAIAKNGSLAGAARELKVNHSTAFRRLQQLESQLSQALFDRDRDGYRLTDFGEVIYKHAQNVDVALADLDRAAINEDSSPKGTIRITAPANIAETFLPGYIRQFQSQYPDIYIDIHIGNQHLDLSRREADMAIRATPTPPDYLIAHFLCSIPWALHASTEFIEHHGTPKTLEDLHGLPLIGAQGELSLLPGFRWLEKHFKHAFTTSANTLNSMSYLAQAGLGIALLPRDQIRADLRVVPIDLNIEDGKWWLLTHPELRNSTRIKLFKKHLIKMVNKDYRLLF